MARTRGFEVGKLAAALTALLMVGAVSGTGAASHRSVSGSALANAPDCGVAGLHRVGGSAHGHGLCTHGRDRIIRMSSLSTSRDAAVEAPAPPCLGDGASGKRVEVIYGVPRDRSDEYALSVPVITGMVAEVDEHHDGSTPAEPGQHYRWACDGGAVRVTDATLLPVGSDGVFTMSDMTRSLKNQVTLGLGPRDYKSRDRIYLVFVDHVEDAYGFGGQATIDADDRPDAAVNANNVGPAYSLLSTWTDEIAAHELEHMLGAVQKSSPHTSGGWHCWDELDVMCYMDGGPYFQGGGVLVEECPALAYWEIDCGDDDYYSWPGSPPEGSYLASHWNTADSGWLSDGQDTHPPTVSPPGNDLLNGSNLGATTVPVRISWSGADAGGAVMGYELQRSNDGGITYADVPLTPSTSSTTKVVLEPGAAQYRFRVRASDDSGNIGEWSEGPAFELNAHQESSGSIAFNGQWSFRTSAGAYGGSLASSSSAGSRASFTFTGTDVAWIATKAANRGKADVYLDGVRVATVDLYAASQAAREMVFTRQVAEGVTHTLQVNVLGTKRSASSGTPVDVDAFVTTD